MDKKTAMQELIEWVEERFSNPHQTEVFKKATELLEKEKEQIMDACNHWKKQKGTCFDDDFIWTGEEYYNQNYNQNK